MLLGLHVEHELRERAMQARERPAQEGEARARELGADVEVEPPSGAPTSTWSFAAKSNSRGVPQRRTSTLPSRRSPTGTLASGRLGSAMSMRVELDLDRLEPLGAAFSSSPMPATSRSTARRVAALALEHADLLRERVALRLQLFGARLQRLALGLERAETRRRRERAAATCAFQARDDARQVLAQEVMSSMPSF